MDFGLYIGLIGTSGVVQPPSETWDRPYSESDFIWNAVPGHSQRAPYPVPTPSRAPTKEFIDGIRPIGSGAIILRRWTGRRSGPWQHRSMPSNLMLAGTQPAANRRSRDGGETWSRATLDLATSCIFVQCRALHRSCSIASILTWCGLALRSTASIAPLTWRKGTKCS